jgi:hypothetical protein
VVHHSQLSQSRGRKDVEQTRSLGEFAYFFLQEPWIFMGPCSDPIFLFGGQAAEVNLANALFRQYP